MKHCLSGFFKVCFMHQKEYSEVVEGMGSGLPNSESHLGLE